MLYTDPLNAALSVVEYRPDLPHEDNVRIAKLRGLMRGYHERWAEQDYETASVERPVYGPLLNPRGGTSRTFRLGAKLDIEATLRGSIGFIDHKTTDAEIDKDGAPYWDSLTIDSQPSQYALLGWLNGVTYEWVLWDVVRKPGIKPAQITTQKLRREIIDSGLYYGYEINEAERECLSESLKRKASEDVPVETPQMYEARLARECTSKPDRYFQRRHVERRPEHIEQYAQEAWDHGQEIIWRRNEGRWPRNPKACLGYKRPCTFLGICSGKDTPDSYRWKRREWVHPELPILEGQDGRDILTNSRMGTLQTCRMKHYLQYELGIERVSRGDEDEAEALVFGTLWHLAQEKWWECYMRADQTTNEGKQTQCSQQHELA